MKNKELKMRVEKLFLKYVEHYPDEYKLVVNYLAGEREKNKDKFASVKNGKVVNRKLYEIPETLHGIFLANLSKEDLLLMREGEDGKDFGRWFAKRFPEFASSTHI